MEISTRRNHSTQKDRKVGTLDVARSPRALDPPAPVDEDAVDDDAMAARVASLRSPRATTPSTPAQPKPSPSRSAKSHASSGWPSARSGTSSPRTLGDDDTYETTRILACRGDHYAVLDVTAREGREMDADALRTSFNTLQAMLDYEVAGEDRDEARRVLRESHDVLANSWSRAMHEGLAGMFEGCCARKSRRRQAATTT